MYSPRKMQGLKRALMLGSMMSASKLLDENWLNWAKPTLLLNNARDFARKFLESRNENWIEFFAQINVVMLTAVWHSHNLVL